MSLILDLLFPKKCVGCKKSGSYFCQDCISNIIQGDLICPVCQKIALGGQTHPICKSQFGLDGLWNLGLYQGNLKSAIQNLKYSYIQELAGDLVDIMVEYWARYQPYLLDKIKKDQGQGWQVVPVPLHWFKQNKRGFNQSSQLAQLFAQSLGLDYIECLKRNRYTKSQTKLKSSERLQNIKNAFELNPNYQLQTMNCLLIDDVWTTGSTMKECCYVLKKAGVKQVWGITLAR